MPFPAPFEIWNVLDYSDGAFITTQSELADHKDLLAGAIQSARAAGGQNLYQFFLRVAVLEKDFATTIAKWAIAIKDD